MRAAATQNRHPSDSSLVRGFGRLENHKKLSCRKETARCFVSLNISPSHSRSLEVIETDTIRKLGYGFLFALYSIWFHLIYHFRDKARYWSKITIFFIFPLHSTTPLGGPYRNIVIPFDTE